MTAQIVSLDSRRGASKPDSAPVRTSSFKTFAEIQDFPLPDPTWVSDDLRECTYSVDDARLLTAFFEWFGVTVDVGRCPESLAAGWEHLAGELGGPAGWKMRSPQTFQALCGDWPQEQVEYLEAVMTGDQATAKRLVWRTPIGALVREKMRTSVGTALVE